MDIVEIQTVYYMVAATGVLIAAVFYILNLRISQRNMKQTLETRQAQFLLSLYQRFSDTEYQSNFGTIMFTMNWTNFDDFTKKYPIESSERTKFFNMAAFYKGIGLLVEQRLIDINTVAKLLGGDVMPFWEKFSPIIMEYRARLNQPGQFAYVEYLYNELKGVKMPSFHYKSETYRDMYPGS